MIYEKRGLYVDLEHLEAYAENFARGIKPVSSASGKSSAAELRKALRALDNLHDVFALKWEGLPSMPAAVRWLLDNRWLLRREGLATARELSRAEHLRFAGGGTVLRLLCDTLLHSGQGDINSQRLLCFLQGFQKTLILEREELAFLPTGLKAAVIFAIEALYRGFANGHEEGADAFAAALFTGLRELSTKDLSKLIESADLVEQTLRADPAGVYPQMADRSRAYYRLVLSRLARQRGTPEHTLAKRLLQLASGASGSRRHIGWWLLREPLGKPKASRQGSGYIAANVLISLFISLLAGFSVKSSAVFLLLLIPVSEVVKQFLDFFLLHLTHPLHIPRLALESGVPPEGRTLCLISALLTGPECASELAERLEEARLIHRDAGPELRFALLADLPESKVPTDHQSEQCIAAAAEAVNALNAKYGGGFFLLTRPRRQNADQHWCGWERKRGALLETMRYLREKDSSICISAGDAAALRGTQFLLVLDSDTRMSPGAASEMIGTMLHPLCRPKLDKQNGRVTEGHAILAPRLGINLTAASYSDFSRIFAGQGGTDPYQGSCSELYMDYFGRSGFAGKGLIDIDAYLQCLGTCIPENRTLSHDAVEGAFLRCGFLGDVEFCDDFPGSVLSYFRRMERWVRGDWQNIIWLFRRGRRLPPLEKWRLFDSIRRSLVPVMTLIAICAGLFGFRSGGLTLAAAAALLALLSELLLTAAEQLLQSDSNRGVHYRSALFVGLGGGLVRAFLRLLLLPAEAWFCFVAALRALWRILISKKKLLQWQTANQSEGSGHSLLRCCKELWFAPVLGLLLLLSPGIIGKAAGILWLLSPVFALLLSLPAEAPLRLSRSEREYLLACAKDTWQYFENFLTEEENFLPPDNVQVRPPAGPARRSSPTNIGCALLSVLSAMDLGFISPEDGLTRIRGCMDSIERLPLWHGHLYNWYDTATCTPLEPRYVSTVDSGNFCACLIALSAGLADYGDTALAARAAKLAKEMDFAPLYDNTRHLFYIGLDISGNTPPNAWYDLMASEARLTAYLTVARGDVPRKHWQRLSRALLQYRTYRGMASWTGTMFEYLMPELLLPLKKNSLFWESARFCLSVQRRRTRSSTYPWGCSESAFRALDPSMNYRYKAHGCAHLALKQGMDDELVISPYSSFLALCVRPHSAIANLRALEALGMRGRWGFWEALDCTDSRLRRGSPGIVYSVMAHHAGMSMIAAANLLLDGVMQRRFLRDPAMRAYTGLLEERVPVGSSVLRSTQEERPRQKPPALVVPGWEHSGSGTDFCRPACCLLSSETYSMLVTESGITRSCWGGISPYVAPRSATAREKGVDLFLETCGKSLSLIPDAYGDKAAEYSWQFSTDSASISAKSETFHCVTTLSLPESDVGERRNICIRNLSANAQTSELVFRFHPLLVREADYYSHPAFCGLGISAKLSNGCLLLRRLPRGNTGELWMCLAPSRPCSFDLAPGTASGRANQNISATETEYFLTDPQVTAVCTLTLEPGEESALGFALGLAHSEHDALESALRILHDDIRADLPRSAATVIGMQPEEIDHAFALLPLLCFPTAPTAPARQEELWPFGISGDLPIVCVRYSGDAELESAKKWMDLHLFLSGCGCSFDLVFLSRDGAAYHQPLRTALSDALWRAGGEALRDAKGGVHLVEDNNSAICIIHTAVLTQTLAHPTPLPDRNPGWRAAFPSRMRQFALQNRTRYDWGKDSRFYCYVNRSLPPRTWQNMLSNGRFGYLATDCGTGHMWHCNAREMQLTPWLCQPNETEGPERIWLQTSDGRHVSLFATAADTACRVSFLPGAAVWEKKTDRFLLKTTAFVPPDTDARILILELEDLSPTAADLPKLHWHMDLLLGGNPVDARFCCTAPIAGGLMAKNARNDADSFFACAGANLEAFTCSRAAALALDYNGACGLCGETTLAMELTPGQKTVLVCGCDTPETLRTLTSPGHAEAKLQETLLHWREKLDRFVVSSPAPELDRIMNGWAAYQVLACRILGRCSIYQSGGAYGFRDQLQDTVNFIALDPLPARNQILHCCTRQYTEGDVQHWWHESSASSRGVRTHCSDDLLWLPWAVCEYVEKTGDLSLCGEQLPYLSSPPLSGSDRDRYEAAAVSDIRENVLRHCIRALHCVMARGCGPHGLLRMGSGDWNDGFDAVHGESQWLSWFFLHVAERFAVLCDRLGTEHDALDRFAGQLARDAELAWDGDWYLRAYYADGRPLGGHENAECRIDSIAQSWSAFYSGADKEKSAAALRSAVERLYDRKAGIVKLFTPPFTGREKPGYITCYGPGFRENGGQYTHGALWLVMALLKSGLREEAWELLSALLPCGKDVSRYLCEPFVIAADVYSAPGHEGEGGWSWYTGSAGWLLRIVMEEFLGLHLRNGLLYIEPRLPENWPGCAIRYFGHDIAISGDTIRVDGTAYHGEGIKL